MLKRLRGFSAALLMVFTSACGDQVMNASNEDITYAFRSCTSYGHQVGTEQHTNCVMTEMQQDRERRASARQSTTTAVIGAAATVVAGFIGVVLLRR